MTPKDYDRACANATDWRQMADDIAEDRAKIRGDLARVRGYAQQLAESADPVFADHGQALLAVLDGGEDR